MNKLRKSIFFKPALILAFFLTMLVTAFSQSSVVGASSHVNHSMSNSGNGYSSAILPPITIVVAVAAAAAATYAAGYAVGTVAHHLWDLFIVVNDPETQRLAVVHYQPTNFSQFDN